MEKIIESLILVAAIFMGVLWLATPNAQADEPTTLTKSVRDEFACRACTPNGWTPTPSSACAKSPDLPLRPHFPVNSPCPIDTVCQ